jgi:hypothetical protein
MPQPSTAENPGPGQRIGAESRLPAPHSGGLDRKKHSTAKNLYLPEISPVLPYSFLVEDTCPYRYSANPKHTDTIILTNFNI